MEHAFWGQDHGEDDVRGFLDGEGIPYERLDDDQVLDRTVDALVAGDVVGWCQGRFEWGPRALGHRSILADPRRADMKDIVNIKIKFREPFRPFAPSVLAEKAAQWFDLGEAAKHHPTRFMLYVAPVLGDDVPAITHADGSSRPQAVHREMSPRYHRLIEKFGEATGVPLVLNTSFNLRGEPIVSSPADALKTFRASGMDMLVLENFVVRKDGGMS
jgi:carbamoyltransferase